MTFSPVYEGPRLAPWMRSLKGKSGAYLIRERGLFGAVLYVGESHTGNLSTTISRHFNLWKGPTAGPTFDRNKTEVAAVRTPPGAALDLQNALIAEHAPKHNIAGTDKDILDF